MPINLELVPQEQTAEPGCEPNDQGQVAETAEPEPEASKEVVEDKNTPPGESFAGFFVAPCNEYAYNAVHWMATKPFEKLFYSVLFIHGLSGVGKTHLLKAAMHMLEQRGIRVLYLTARDFRKQVVDALMGEGPENIRQLTARYESYQVLMLDDMQELKGMKPDAKTRVSVWAGQPVPRCGGTDTLRGHNPPEELENLSEAVQSRMAATIEISRPDVGAAKEILVCQMEQYPELSIPDEVLDFIAETIHPNLHILKMALMSLCGYMSLQQGAVMTLDLAKKLLKGKKQRSDASPLSVDSIVESVAEIYGMTLTRSERQRLREPRG